MSVTIGKQWPLATFFWAAIAGFWGGPVQAAQVPKGTGGIMAPGPDVEAAVQSEYDGVVRKGTREAYERFIRRHPGHKLVQKAREALAKGGLR
ncbi:hypothetical protein ADU59_17665 [Pararhizobium polonicum]|uniref:Uncharacterized protein n=1 Tax=Pararhizobium polonicum TaxID=1612624 RepID=A0A1C7NYH5_9HYPH|nr:hypothetical protein [Pararhizobium polonicum]OBZ94033.1 hypothetical protein ADU59_17665 [Pararhizobium polonicum]